MNDEIKEILELFAFTDENIMFGDIVELNSKQSHLLLDYITKLQEDVRTGQEINSELQQENKEWGMIFDTFSSRPYAHRYLEEKRKELGNKRIIGLDSEMIYKEYYDLKEIEQDHKETNATLMSELAKMKEENERLKEENNNKAMNDYAHAIDESWYRELYDDYKSRCEKASDKLSFIDEALENDTLNVPLCITKINSALNILQNGSDDNE